MALTQADVVRLVQDQLQHVTDERAGKALAALLVDPYCLERPWDYGEPGQTYPCWTVLEHQASDTAIAYCEHGFGPAAPWGLVWLEREPSSMGADYAWYDRLVDAFLESMAAPRDEP